jgi:type IV pilus assembly protein PilV
MALIEALVSILIFSFGVLGLIGLEASAINFSVDAEDRNRAALFANEIASNIWLAGSVTVPAAQLVTWQTAIADPTQTGLPNGTVTITPTAGTTNSVDIVLNWKPQTDTTGAANRELTTRVILP